MRVAATIEAYFDFVDEDGGAFRLVFESDLVNQPEVRERVEGRHAACAEAISEVIADDAGLPEDEAHLLAVGLIGMAQVVGPLLAGRPTARSRVTPPSRCWPPCRGAASAGFRCTGEPH